MSGSDSQPTNGADSSVFLHLAKLETQTIEYAVEMLIDELDARSTDPDHEIEPLEDSDDDTDGIS